MFAQYPFFEEICPHLLVHLGAVHLGNYVLSSYYVIPAWAVNDWAKDWL